MVDLNKMLKDTQKEVHNLGNYVEYFTKCFDMALKIQLNLSEAHNRFISMVEDSVKKLELAKNQISRLQQALDNVEKKEVTDDSNTPNSPE